LSAILGHLYTMLVLVRIEKTRLPKDLQPVLVACHHLTSTGDAGIKRFFMTHVFPPLTKDAPVSGMPRRHHPASPAFFHKHLTFFLTSLDTTIKRCMGEWLYLLCDQNGTFTPLKSLTSRPRGLTHVFPCPQPMSTRDARDWATPSGCSASRGSREINPPITYHLHTRHLHSRHLHHTDSRLPPDCPGRPDRCPCRPCSLTAAFGGASGCSAPFLEEAETNQPSS
jgi:hypothetical protein